MEKICVVFIVLYFIAESRIWAQDSLRDRITLIGYGDFYYTYDFNEPPSGELPSFLYSHTKHNGFAVNNMVVGVTYTDANVRAAASFHTGTYVRANYAAEPQLLRSIYELSAGFQISKTLSVDAGIFPSHLGFESVLSKENLTLTRSMTAENSPYYESGVKVSLKPSGKWLLSGFVLNGWQNIQETNSNKALATQIKFTPVEGLTINSSAFWGNEKPDSAKQYRFFHDAYVTYSSQARWKLIAGFDTGWEQDIRRSSWLFWWNTTLIASYRWSEKIATAARLEYFEDPHHVVNAYNAPDGFTNSGASLNLDYHINEHIVFRCEGKIYQSGKRMYHSQNGWRKNDVFLFSSLAFSL